MRSFSIGFYLLIQFILRYYSPPSDVLEQLKRFLLLALRLLAVLLKAVHGPDWDTLDEFGGEGSRVRDQEVGDRFHVLLEGRNFFLGVVVPSLVFGFLHLALLCDVLGCCPCFRLGLFLLLNLDPEQSFAERHLCFHAVDERDRWLSVLLRLGTHIEEFVEEVFVV